MARPSRIELIEEATAATGASVALVSAGRRTVRARAPACDPMIAEVATWMGAKDAVEALEQEWRDLERQLSLKVRPLNIDLIEGGRSSLPEVRAMRALTRKMRAADRELERVAERIALMRARSVAGALAKIELGLQIQGPYDWQDHALALVRGGIEQLRQLA